MVVYVDNMLAYSISMEGHGRSSVSFLSSFVSTACVQSLKVRILNFLSHISRPRPSAKYITSTLESASPLLIPSSIFNQSGVVPCWQVIIVVPLKISSKLLNLSQSFQEENGVLSPQSR